jgi:hypothetical protein
MTKSDRLVSAEEEPTCKTCVFFRRDSTWPTGYPYRGFGKCAKITDDHGLGDTDSEGPEGVLAIAWDYEGYSAGIHVHENFGCVLWSDVPPPAPPKPEPVAIPVNPRLIGY